MPRRERLRRGVDHAPPLARVAAQRHLGGLGERHRPRRAEGAADPAGDRRGVPVDEVEVTTGADSALDGAVDDLATAIRDDAEVEGGARRLAGSMATVLAASLLVRHADPVVAEAFIATRVAGRRWAPVRDAAGRCRHRRHLRQGGPRLSGHLFDVVLHRPEIAPNTGNLMRLSVNTGCRLHLVHPLGFDLDERRVRRAGLDYRDRATVTEHADFEAMVAALAPARLYAYTGRGRGPLRRRRPRRRRRPALRRGVRRPPEELLAHPAVTATVRIPVDSRRQEPQPGQRRRRRRLRRLAEVGLSRRRQWDQLTSCR